jgi:uncharacterized protein YndB with AHSA1/START domain
MMTAVLPASDTSVRKSVTVKSGVTHAFKVFTEGFDSWWPRSHHIGKQPMTKAVIECRPGGRCYGQSADGTDSDWGRVLVWEPPHRLVIAWHINGEWQYEPDASKTSEVDIRFTAEGDGSTRVDLEHRHLDRHGAGADSIRTAVAGPGGWSGLLQMYRDAARTFSPVVAPLAAIFRTDDWLITRALDGLDEAELWNRPTDRTNPLLWIVGHVVQTRAHALGLVGRAFDTGWGPLFDRGAALQALSAYPALPAVNEMRTKVTAAWLDALASLSDERLASPAVGPPLPNSKTIADQIGFFAMHDAYHAGQMGYIRKALGKAGLAG